MSIQHEHVVARSINSEVSLFSRSSAEAFLRRMVGDVEYGELIIETPTGVRLVFGGHRPGPQAKLAIHSWRCLCRLASNWDIGFAEAYIAGEWSSPNLVALLKFAGGNGAVVEPLKTLRTALLAQASACHEPQHSARQPP